MIICVCKAVNERAIRHAIAAGHDTFDALQFELGVGTCCGKCVGAACEVLCEAVAPSSESRVTEFHVMHAGRRPAPRSASPEPALA